MKIILLNTAIRLIIPFILLGSLPRSSVAVTTIVVTSIADQGPGTLRQALLDARAGDVITFNTSLFQPAQPVTIFIKTPLPTLTKNNLTIDASDTGVVLDGSQASVSTNGLLIDADNGIIQGLTIQHFGSNGIFIASGATGNIVGGSRNSGVGPNGQGNLIIFNKANGIEIRGNANLVRGNFIGVDSSGREKAGNRQNGVAIGQGGSDNIVGGNSSSQRNIIGWNGENGIWIGGNGSNANHILGNYIGVRLDGLGPVDNGFSGIALQDGAQNNWIGSTLAGEGNLISGNTHNGIYISGNSTNGNQVLGNRIGTDWAGSAIVGQLQNGVVINQGASNNQIGDGTAGGRNLISGNAQDGVLIADNNTVNNVVKGNYIGSTLTGDKALPNGQHGVEITNNAQNSIIENNLLSGNHNHGLVIHFSAHHNFVFGNLVGPNATGNYSLGNHPNGGIDIAQGAHDNIIGGLGAGQGNLISGNQTDGIAFFSEGNATVNNQVIGNYIGLTSDGNKPLPNIGPGISVLNGAALTQISKNVIAYNAGNGVWVPQCVGITLSQNSIYSNTQNDISATCPAPPQLIQTKMGPPDTVMGKATSQARLEFFSDDNKAGKIYEGSTTADTAGFFTYTKQSGFVGTNLTATSTDTSGNTSAFSAPRHLDWTLLLYFNGDNDLEAFILETIATIIASGPSPRANIMALVDTLDTESGTILYDLTAGQATRLDEVTGEHNMGDGQTLIDFVTRAKARYPAHHTLLSILDHGGGWAPNSEVILPGVTPGRRPFWLSGGSGLSWDLTDGYDYLNSKEIRQALATITDNGVSPLDVVFYDVCLMGMIEVAYQIQEYATYFVSSQNMGWAPSGTQNRYVQVIKNLEPKMSPPELAALLTQKYADSLPATDHPLTVSAFNLTYLPDVVMALNHLAALLDQTLVNDQSAGTLRVAYEATQKLDYDSDFSIESQTDGFVDLYDFAVQIAQQYSSNASILSAAQSLMAALDQARVAEQHRSGSPWMLPNQVWNFDRVHGLSIFLPLGEDLELPLVITDTLQEQQIITRNVKLRETYNGEQLHFAGTTNWSALISKYYNVINTPVMTATTTGPVDGLQNPDVTPPQSTIVVPEKAQIGETIQISWSVVDTQSGVQALKLWHKLVNEPWHEVTTQTVSSGVYSFLLQNNCVNEFSISATDMIGNVEPIDHISNIKRVDVLPCYQNYFPLVAR